MSRPYTMTQQKMLCDLYQAQLSACSLNLLRTMQLLVLGSDAEQKLNDAEKMSIPQVQLCLRKARSDGVFKAFCDMLSHHEQCKHLPTIINNLATAYIECLQLSNVALPSNSLKMLFEFMLRTCLEKPIILHANDTRDGAHLELFRSQLALFYAECVLPS